MRQYERKDCLGVAVVGQVLTVGCSSIPANDGGECDSVYCFGNDSCGIVSWVPYGSTVEVEKERYFVVKGQTRYDEPDKRTVQSVECLLDKNGELQSLSAVVGKSARVIVIPAKKSLLQMIGIGKN